MSLTDAADVAKISPTHLQRIFAARVKESPAKYQQRLRLERAAADLRSSGLRITMKEDPMATSEITRESIDETPTVVARRRVDKDQMADALAECLPAAYGYVMEAGLTMAGPPFVRYLSQSAAFFEIEAGVPLVEPAGAVHREDLFASALPGGDAAVAIHHGSYESLGDTHLAIDRWINDNELTASGGPWEIYLTDPGEVPNPNDWQTKIVSPLA